MTNLPGEVNPRLNIRFPSNEIFHQTLVAEDTNDGLSRDVIFGTIVFRDPEGVTVQVDAATIALPLPLHLVDFVQMPNTTWRLRLWGGFSGHTYQARVLVPGYQPIDIALILHTAVTDQPLLSAVVIGRQANVDFGLVGFIAGLPHRVVGMVGA